MVVSVLLGVLCGVSLCAVGAIAHWPTKPDARMALLDAIAAARLTSKEIYMALGYTQSYWSRIERGEVPLPPLCRLEKLPPAVWDHLMPRMAYVVWSRRQHPEEEGAA
jgi:hypothetical protein